MPSGYDASRPLTRSPGFAFRLSLAYVVKNASKLKQMSSDLTRQKLPEAFEVEAVVGQLADLMGGATR